MHIPRPAPDLSEILASTPETLRRILGAPVQDERYLHWDELRHRTPPPGLSTREWWAAIRLRRDVGARRIVNLTDGAGRPFHFTLPDVILRLIDDLTRRTSGEIRVSEVVTDESTRDRYIVSSLMEEAITSSQLEGAVTSRKAAKDMLRSGRAPRDRSEQMIVNNYRAMERIRELRSTPLRPDLVLELHRIVTDGTLDNPEAAGRLQTSKEPRVSVYSYDDQLLHEPPPADQLPTRLASLCDFANGDHPEYVPPLLRAITVHFMAGHDHYFEDGNGRTARALFYWCMLKEGFWLTEYLTISTILKRAPGQYARAFLHTESDAGDLTYFHLHQLRVLAEAVDRLHEHLAESMRETRRVQRDLGSVAFLLNHRQLALLHHAVKHPGFGYTALSHSRSHRVTHQTGLSDLQSLERLDLLLRTKEGRRYLWLAPSDLPDRVARLTGV